MPHPRIVLFGAYGKLGRALLLNLCEQGYTVVAVSRKVQDQSNPLVIPIGADLDHPESLKDIIQSGDIVINTAHARFTGNILKYMPLDVSLFINIGSTRYLTKFVDKAAQHVREAMALMDTWPGPWVMFHPTMIYGTDGENNVRRMAQLIRKFKLIPLPQGGKSLIQPIHTQDVIAYILKAIALPRPYNRHLHIAGPQSLRYAQFIKRIAQALDMEVIIIPLPLKLIHFLAVLTRFIPLLPTITKAEVDRLMEDKDINIKPAQDIFNIPLIPLDKGLKDLFLTDIK